MRVKESTKRDKRSNNGFKKCKIGFKDNTKRVKEVKYRVKQSKNGFKEST